MIHIHAQDHVRKYMNAITPRLIVKGLYISQHARSITILLSKQISNRSDKTNVWTLVSSLCSHIGNDTKLNNCHTKLNLLYHHQLDLCIFHKVPGLLAMAATTLSNASHPSSVKYFLHDERHTFSSRKEAVILSGMISI